MRRRKEGWHPAALAGVLAVMIICTVVAMFTRQYYISEVRQRVRSTTIRNVEELTKSKAQLLDEKIRTEMADIQTLAVYLDGFTDLESCDLHLLDEYRRIHRATDMLIVEADGRGINADGGRFEVEPKDRGMFAPAWNGRTDMSDVYIGRLGKRHVLLQTPLKKDGRTVAGLYLSLPVDELQDTYGKETYTDSGYSYVLRNSGEVMLAPVRYNYIQIYDKIQDMLLAEGNEAGTIGQFLDAMADGHSGSAVFAFDGESQLVYFVPLELKEDWYLASVIPLSVVEKEGNQIIGFAYQMVALITAAVALAVLLIAFFFYYTNKKKRENGLFLNNIYQAISENIDTVIFILDGKTSRVEYVFENSSRILGVSVGELQELALSEGQGSGGEFQRKLKELLKQQRPDQKISRELHVFNEKLSEDTWLKVTIYPFSLGGEAKFIIAVTDITQEKKTEERLKAAVEAAEKANAAKSRFLSEMSHDIRTPMNAIIGMTVLALNSLGEPDKIKRCLEKITVASNLLLGIINDVLDMSRIESGKLTLSDEGFSINEMLDGVVTVIQPQCAAKNQEFTVEEKNIAYRQLGGDLLRIHQVLLNLLSNAVKFTPKGGKINLTVEEFEIRDSGFVPLQITVKDTGAGISPEFLDKLFTPFEREKNSTVSQIQGTGLGLAIAKSLLNAMGGQLAVESELGKGTCFTVYLELRVQKFEKGKANKRQPEIQSVQSIGDLTGRRFLIAEDNEMNREIATEIFEMAGACVETAENGEEAVRMFLSREGGYYDAIFMDIQMPVMNGYEACRAIRGSGYGNCRDIPVIAMTANVFAEDKKAAKEAGMTAHVGKPINLEEIAGCL